MRLLSPLFVPAVDSADARPCTLSSFPAHAPLPPSPFSRSLSLSPPLAPTRSFWRAHSQYVVERDALHYRASALETRLATGTRELDKLQRTNVYSALALLAVSSLRSFSV